MDIRSPILNVEDDEAKRYLVSRVLRQAGLAVIEAASGSEAVQVATAQQPALIVLDVKLPDMSGFEVCRQLKAHPATAAIPVVYRSNAYLQLEDKLRGLQSGAVGYLAGEEPQELVATVQAVLRLRQAQEAVRHSEAQFRALVENGLDVVGIVDRQGTLHYVNPSFERVLGYPPAVVIDRPVITFVHPEDQAKVQQVLAQALRQPGIPWILEVRSQHHDGSWRTLEVVAQYCVERDGVDGVVCNARDITTRKQAEDALRANEHQIRALLDAAPDALVVVNEQGHIVMANAQAVLLFGYTQEELCGARVEMLLPDRFRDRHVQHRARYYAAPRVRRMGEGLELFGRHKEGREFPVEISLSPVTNPDGILVISAIRDITARKQVEAALQQREQEFATLVEHSPDIIFRLDRQLRHLFVNKNNAVEQLTGLPPAALLGKTGDEMGQPPEIWDPFKAACQRLFDTGQPQALEFASGGRSYRTRLIPERSVEGQVATLLGATEDRTEQKAAEEALVRSNAELQQFAYIMSHDLQEPLRTISNFVQLFAARSRDKLEGETQEYLAFVVDGAERMQALIRDLAHYTRVGDQQLKRTAVDCEAVLARVLADLHLAIADSQAVVTHEPLPTVWGSPTRLGVLFQNLLSNALKFRGAAPPQIHLSARQDGAQWVVMVRDNGIGLDPRHAERIFRVFQRLHTRGEYPGTGIGLAICKKIVEQHGGRIWAESEPGKGATFFFTLPRAPGQESTHAGEESAAGRE